MFNRLSYSINRTGDAWGVRNDITSSRNTLKTLLELIDNHASAPFEVTTPAPSNNAHLSVTGRIPCATNNGHLVLNPKGVDLRIVPGNIKNLLIKKMSSNCYKATFLNSNGAGVLHATFYASADLKDGMFHVESIRGKFRMADTGRGLEHTWRSLRDVHHFFPMLQQFGISKLAAFRQVPDDLAYQVNLCSVRSVLSYLLGSKEHFMIFVGNDSVFQVYTGPVKKIHEFQNQGQTRLVVHGATAEGNSVIFKLTMSDLSQVWVVNKFSESGPISSLELFDKQGNHVAQFNGLRNEGMPQKKSWVSLAFAKDCKAF